MKLNKIKKFVKQREKLISVVLSILMLIGWVVFLLGFVFAHGVCCGDDAALAFIARSVSEGKRMFDLLTFDPHIAVLLPVSFGIIVFDNAYWVPGLMIVIFNSLMLLLMGYLLNAYNDHKEFAITALAFFYLNFFLLTMHFEHWYAALGEVPAGLLILISILLLHLKDSWLTDILAGLSMSLAYFTKMLTLIAFGGVLVTLLILFLYSIIRIKREETKSILKKLFCLIGGFLFPLTILIVLLRFNLIPQIHINRLIDKITYIFISSGILNPQNIVINYLKGAEVLLGRFGVPFFSLLLMIGFAGLLIRNDEKLKKVYYSLLAIILFHSVWWFFFSIHWARHYIINIIVVIFVLIMPFLIDLQINWKFSYISCMLLWSALTWNNARIPFEQLDGHFYNPTKQTKALVDISETLSNRVKDDLIITQAGYTAFDMRYLIEAEVKVRSFRSDLDYHPPFWIFVNTKFMNQQDPAFMRLLRECSGLEEYEGYLVGRCE